MKISIKTLKGELFQVDAETTDSVGELKNKIFNSKNDLPAERQKLIHAGKVLKDDQIISDLGISESDFIVCMITKEVAKKPTPAPVAAAVTAVPAPAAASTAVAPPSAPTSTSTPAPAPAVAPTPAAQPTQYATAEGVEALSAMGFNADDCRAALNAAMGNPDLAYEFLCTGIPESAPGMQFGVTHSPAMTAPAAAPPTGGSTGIEQLRQHPQFNMLKQLIQTNPAAINQVLDLIGQQSPDLLAAIHANHEAFVAMMNEPIDTTTPAPVAAPPVAAPPTAAPGANPMQDPTAMVRMLSAMPAQQRAQFATTLGMTPEQLEGFMQMMAQIPPAELQQMLAGAGMGGMGGGMSPGGGADAPGVIRLTEEEMAAVNRLMALGFSQQQAAQAYLACDKNEGMAANLLFDGGWGGDEGDYGDGGGGMDDDMYN